MSADNSCTIARALAHAAFDPIWRDGPMNRTDAYAWLARVLGMRRDDCHIARLDAATCARVVAAVDDWQRGARLPRARDQRRKTLMDGPPTDQPKSLYCPMCGARVASANTRTRTCSPPCRLALALAEHGVAQGQPVTEDPWALASPAHHQPLGAAMSMALRPRARREVYAPTEGVMWHGVVTALLRDGHSARAEFSAWPGGDRWWLLTPSPEAAKLLGDRIIRQRVGCLRGHLAVGPACPAIVPAPRAPGRYRVRVTAETPVVVRAWSAPGESEKRTQTSPSDHGLASTLASTLGARVLPRELLPDLVPVAVVRDDTTPAALRLGGKVGGDGILRGWVGAVTVETSALGAWLLEASARVGLGGRTPFGCGRVDVEVMR